jgi:hypothetical protein
MSLIEENRSAFALRAIPDRTVTNNQPRTDLYADALYFQGRKWESIRPDELEQKYSAFSGFTYEAFRYYLPSVIHCSVAHNRPHLIVVSDIVSRLNYSDVGTGWKLFEHEPWDGLSKAEFKVLSDWTLWLSSNNGIDQDILVRAFAVLERLRKESPL